MKFIDPRIHLVFLLIIALGFITYVRAMPTIIAPPVNKTQLCSLYEEAFVTAAALYQDTSDCKNLEYSLASFRQLLYTECPIDKDYVTITHYLTTQPCKLK